MKTFQKEPAPESCSAASQNPVTIHTYIHIVRIYKHKYTYTNAHKHIHTHTHTHIHKHIHIQARTHKTHTYVHTYIQTRMCVCVCVYTERSYVPTYTYVCNVIFFKIHSLKKIYTMMHLLKIKFRLTVTNCCVIGLVHVYLLYMQNNK